MTPLREPQCDHTPPVPLQPGPDLDMAVHLALGAAWDPKQCRVCGWPLGRFPNCTMESCSQRPSPNPRADSPPAYSTSGDAMLTVIGKMRADGWHYTIHSNIDKPGAWVLFENANDGAIFHTGDGPRFRTPSALRY